MDVRGVQIWKPLNKWKFSNILPEEFTKLNSVIDRDNTIDLNSEMPSIPEK